MFLKMIDSVDIWDFLQKTKRPIALYGMGNGAESVIKQLQKIGKSAVGVFASDGFVRGQNFCGYKVTSYDLLAVKYPDMIILVCFGSNRQEVLQYIGLLRQKHTVLCPDVPVYGEQVFDFGFAQKSADQIRRVYALLADDYSKETYRNIIEFKLTGQSEKLKSCQFSGGLFDPINISNNETFVDLGAYRGDTVQAFLDRVDQYHKIFAFEPNFKTYQKLTENVKKYENVFSVNKAVSDYEGVATLVSAGRGSAVEKRGQSVSVCSLDLFFSNQSVSLIKMDVEGQERQALLGARDLIMRCHPKMIVAAYHRSEDIFSLPLLVHEMCADYRIYIRHAPHNLAWDTNFYFGT